jgi:protein TonB
MYACGKRIGDLRFASGRVLVSLRAATRKEIQRSCIYQKRNPGQAEDKTSPTPGRMRMALSGLPLPDRAIVIVREHPYSRTRNRNTEMTNPPKSKLNGSQGPAGKQRSQLRIAFAFVIVALAVLLIRDREFWFGPEPTESDSSVSQSVPASNPAPLTAKSTPAPATPAVTTPAQTASSVSTEPVQHQKSHPAVSSTRTPAAKRTVLPPLRVEVIGNNHHHAAQPVRETDKLQYSTDSKRPLESAVVPTNAAQIEPLTGEAVPELRQTLNSTYPLLGPRMKVQGSVVLQAVIGADGNIENLRVVSGPAILTAAAQQAVRQWRFKPYMQNGEPVETKATITVNFSIRISDDAAARIS